MWTSHPPFIGRTKAILIPAQAKRKTYRRVSSNQRSSHWVLGWFVHEGRSGNKMELKKNTRTSNMRRGCTTPNKSALNEGGRCKKHFAHTPLSVTEKPKAVLMFVAIQELTASSCSTFFKCWQCILQIRPLTFRTSFARFVESRFYCYFCRCSGFWWQVLCDVTNCTDENNACCKIVAK